MQRNLYLIVLIVFAVSILCKRIPTLPETEPEPGSRNYIWELDTLNSPMNYISAVWGATPNDVWAVGGGGTYQDRLWHYDGVEWSIYNKEAINVGGMTLWGTGPNNVWMGGQGGWGVEGAAIWHFNGKEWSQFYNYKVDGAYIISIEKIWGTSANDVYACGIIDFKKETIDNWRGFVLHFDGKKWKEIVRATFNSQFLKIRKNDNKVIVQSYAMDYKSSAQDIIAFYQISDNKLDEIYSTTLKDVYWASLHVIDGITYFVVGEEVYSYQGAKMIEQFTVPNSEFNCQIYGRNNLDLFLSMKDGIAHYNGTDVEYIYTYPNESMGNINDPIIFKNEIFFCVLNLNSTPENSNLILHGKILK